MWDLVQQYGVAWLGGVIISCALLLACIWNPKMGRKMVGLLFLLGGIANIYLAWIYPRDYLVFGQFTFFEGYRRFIYMILFRQAAWMGGILVGVHFYLTYAFWKEGPVSIFAVATAILFFVLISPLGFGAAFPAPLILIIAVIYLYKMSPK